MLKDYSQAFKWFKHAADQGNQFGQYNVGRFLLGDNGITKDLVQAYAWLNVASANGNKSATDLRDKVPLDANQLIEAQGLSREILKKSDKAKEFKSSQVAIEILNIP